MIGTTFANRLPVKLLILGAGVLAKTAHADCNSDFICIHEDQLDDRIELRAENRSEFPITYSVRVRSRDLQAAEIGRAHV